MIAEWGDGRNMVVADRMRARIKVRLERAEGGPWRKCITATAKEPWVILDKVVEAIHAAICEESLADHMDPEWPGRCVKAAHAVSPILAAGHE